MPYDILELIFDLDEPHKAIIISADKGTTPQNMYIVLLEYYFDNEPISFSFDGDSDELFPSDEDYNPNAVY